MNWFEAMVLGLIQGLTEFLPVSSSGHLELGKYLFGMDHEANFYFSIAVHGATVLSTIVVLWKEIAGLFKGFFKIRLNEETSYVLKIFVSMIPVGIAGFFLKDIAENFFTGNMISLGIEFMITAFLLFLTLVIKPKERPIGFIDSFIVGIAQAIAILPGISRSGATIATGMMIGNKKSDIAKFSFLMVLIPIVGANLVEMKTGDFSTEGTSFLVILTGFVVAFLSGYFACKWMINLVKKGNLVWFAVYCVIVGIFSILLGLHVI
ncbi:MAG: undecaprenyl-diphosphate phosphatase [Bacteroidales bacterium]|nr:undecaprenyl-diphosphate phosphatase [Bacteroidales bacterium]